MTRANLKPDSFDFGSSAKKNDLSFSYTCGVGLQISIRNYFFILLTNVVFPEYGKRGYVLLGVEAMGGGQNVPLAYYAA